MSNQTKAERAIEMIHNLCLLTPWQIVGIENLKCGKELLVIRSLTHDQSERIQDFLKCDLFHSEPTGDTIECNRYYFTNFRIN